MDTHHMSVSEMPNYNPVLYQVQKGEMHTMSVSEMPMHSFILQRTDEERKNLGEDEFAELVRAQGIPNADWKKKRPTNI